MPCFPPCLGVNMHNAVHHRFSLKIHIKLKQQKLFCRLIWYCYFPTLCLQCSVITLYLISVRFPKSHRSNGLLSTCATWSRRGNPGTAPQQRPLPSCKAACSCTHPPCMDHSYRSLICVPLLSKRGSASSELSLLLAWACQWKHRKQFQTKSPALPRDKWCLL